MGSSTCHAPGRMPDGERLPTFSKSMIAAIVARLEPLGANAAFLALIETDLPHSAARL